jgi:UDP-2-acetamido-2-deoxy-ribo-hexuluronate aminotransferase
VTEAFKMQFRDLKSQYKHIKGTVDTNIQEVINDGNFIQGNQIKELEERLADYVGVKHCITCANGTDALQLAFMAWGVGSGDAVFVPDFTFFSSGEVVSAVGATPIFVDVDSDTYNISVNSLIKMIEKVVNDGIYKPRVIVAVDLFGQPADYNELRKTADKYGMYILEDSAQGFGGMLGDKRDCSFGDISTTSFFPAKPLGCYGDGGAVFTDNSEWDELIRSYKVHGKGSSKYDNIRIGMNSRLDTLQAAVLLAKLPVFAGEELENEQKIALKYTEKLKEYVKVPVIRDGFYSSWAQYTIQLKNSKMRDGLQKYLKDLGIPAMVYYQKPMHLQKAFDNSIYNDDDYPNTNRLCDTVLSLPFHPYMSDEDVELVAKSIIEYVEEKG